VITLGVDLAAEPKRTGLARIVWRQGSAHITDARRHVSDDEMVEAIVDADKAGIDCPLGWPVKFIRFITSHDSGHVALQPGVAGREWRRALSYRVTDLRARQLGLQPLSVSTDRIGVTAMRCAGLMSRLAAMGEPVDRTGAGRVVEVYPAASLLRWGFNYRGYKQQKGVEALDALVEALQAALPWLDFGAFEDECRTSDDVFDAVVSALTARAAAIGKVEAIPDASLDAAAVEGWIALPTDDIGALQPADR
jgi:predicted nuclease with RNAse H fold